MVPVVTGMSPAMQLKKVDLPAPFGPIRPIMSPDSTERSAPATARKLPNALETFFASSSMAAPPSLGREAVPQIEQAARFETRDDDDDAAIENVSEARATAAEPGVGSGLEWNEDQRAEQRAVERARAAERGDDHHLHGDENAEAALRIDEAGLERI